MRITKSFKEFEQVFKIDTILTNYSFVVSNRFNKIYFTKMF